MSIDNNDNSGWIGTVVVLAISLTILVFWVSTEPHCKKQIHIVDGVKKIEEVCSP